MSRTPAVPSFLMLMALAMLGLGVACAYGALVLVALPCGLTALLVFAVATYVLAVTVGWGRGWSQPRTG